MKDRLQGVGRLAKAGVAILFMMVGAQAMAANCGCRCDYDSGEHCIGNLHECRQRNTHHGDIERSGHHDQPGASIPNGCVYQLDANRFVESG